MLRSCILLLLLVLGASLPAQKLAPFVFTTYNPLKGLASNELEAVVQDKAGYLWIGTNNGLQRFDGVKFKTFRHREGDSTSVPSNSITRLFLDGDNNLWLLTHKGEVALFDVKRFTSRRVTVRLKRPFSAFGPEVRFIPDEEGHLFLSVRGGELAMYDKAKNEFSTAASIIPVPSGWAITTVSQQPGTKKYWLGLQSGGVAIYNRATGVFSYYGSNREAEPAVDIIGPKRILAYSLFDNKGRFWFEQWTGASVCVQVDLTRKQNPLREHEFLTSLKTYYEIHSIKKQRDGRIWVTGLQVFAYYDEATESFVVVPGERYSESGIEYQEITTLFEDNESNLWVGTRNNGLYRFNPSSQIFSNVAHRSRDPKNEKPGKGGVLSFIETPKGDVFTGIWEDGVRRYNSKFEEIPLGVTMRRGQNLRDAYVWSMCQSADGRTVWMGAQPGLGVYDTKTESADFRNPPPLNNHTIRQVIEDKAGNLWLGMHRYGLFRWVDPRNPVKDSIQRIADVKDETVNKLIVDRRGWVWVATGGEGLFVFDAATARLLKHVDGDRAKNQNLPGSGITGLLDYNDSLVLVANLDRLFIYNRNNDSFQTFQTVRNFLGNITALEKDNAGFVWASTTNALYRLRPGSKSALVNNRLSGITNDRFTLSASHKLRDGRLLFGTASTFVFFDPARANTYEASAPVYITGIAIGKEELLMDSVSKLERLLLNAKNNSLTVDFSTLTFNKIYAVQYMIEGVDADWQVADRNFRISYPFLPVGRFTLKLRAYNPEGAPSPVTELQIRVKPPWYQSWWFYTLVAIAFVVELWWLDRQRMRRKETLQKVRTDIATGLHEEVNTALNNINILSEIARLKSDRDPQRAKEYLEQIHSKSHNMIIAMDDMLWSLNPENDAMDKTISRIREFADALTQRHGAVVELLIDKRVEKMELNMKLRHEAFLLFKEGLRSLVAAGTRHCVVHLTAERGRLLFTIEFENEGCDMQQLNNLLHRRDMELRLQALKAKLDVQLHKSRSVFLLQLPLA